MGSSLSPDYDSFAASFDLSLLPNEEYADGEVPCSPRFQQTQVARDFYDNTSSRTITMDVMKIENRLDRNTCKHWNTFYKFVLFAVVTNLKRRHAPNMETMNFCQLQYCVMPLQIQNKLQSYRRPCFHLHHRVVVPVHLLLQLVRLQLT